MHLHVFHPSSDKFFRLFSRPDSSKATPELQKVLNEISAACNECRVFSTRPYRFSVSLLSEKIILNHESAIDLHWLHNRLVLQVVCTHMHFSSAIWAISKCAGDIWFAFLECWSTVYIGYSNKIRSDRETGVTSELFRNPAEINSIKLHFSPVEVHNAMGRRERYHTPLRRIYSVLSGLNPSLNAKTTLSLAAKEMDDSMGPEELVPSLIIFGVMPSVLVINKSLPEQRERMEYLSLVPAEMATLTAEIYISQAIKSRLPPATPFLFSTGYQIRVYKKVERRWCSPLKVSH